VGGVAPAVVAVTPDGVVEGAEVVAGVDDVEGKLTSTARPCASRLRAKLPSATAASSFWPRVLVSAGDEVVMSNDTSSELL